MNIFSDSYITNIWIDDYLVMYYHSNSGFLYISSLDFKDNGPRDWMAYMFYSEAEAIQLHLYRMHSIDIEIDDINDILSINNKTEA